MRLQLEDVEIAIADTHEPSTTTIDAAGAYVLVISTTIAARAVGLTSCYLGQPEGATAASHLHLGPDRGEHLAQRVIAPGRLHPTVAGACLLDHAAELQEALAERTGAIVSVDIGTSALQRAAEVWGPPGPPDRPPH